MQKVELLWIYMKEWFGDLTLNVAIRNTAPIPG
jgi:hypothetical protein